MQRVHNDTGIAGVAGQTGVEGEAIAAAPGLYVVSLRLRGRIEVPSATGERLLVMVEAKPSIAGGGT